MPMWDIHLELRHVIYTVIASIMLFFCYFWGNSFFVSAYAGVIPDGVNAFRIIILVVAILSAVFAIVVTLFTFQVVGD
jgi:hypothetical protein